jgi:hypothetical protein
MKQGALHLVARRAPHEPAPRSEVWLSGLDELDELDELGGPRR